MEHLFSFDWIWSKNHIKASPPITPASRSGRPFVHDRQAFFFICPKNRKKYAAKKVTEKVCCESCYQYTDCSVGLCETP